MTVPGAGRRPAASAPARSHGGPGEQQRLASAVVRAAVETEQAMAEPGSSSGGLAGRSSWPARRSWPRMPRARQVADELAAEDPLPPPLRVFQELYEVAPARAPARLPAAEQRAAAPAGAGAERDAPPSRPGRNSTPVAWRRSGPCGSASGPDGLGLGDADRGRAVRPRADPGADRGRYPEAEPLPDRPELDELLPRSGSMSPGTPGRRPTTGRTASRSLDHVGLVPAPDRQLHAAHGPPRRGHARGRRGPPVRGAAAPRPPRRRVPGADRPAQPDAAVRGRTSAAVPGAAAGLVRRPALRAPPGRPRTGDRLAGRQQADGAPAGSGLAEPAATWSRGSSRRSPPS